MARMAVNAQKPDGLLAQYNVLCAVIDSKWATSLDHRVARHVIDRYYPSRGNGRASLRYLEQATGSRRNKIVPSLRRLVDQGVFTVARVGAGTRPTEYTINFEFGKAASGALHGTSTSGAGEGTPGSTLQVPAKPSSGAPAGTESYLPDRLTSRSTVSRNEDAHAVPRGGACPATALTARGPNQASSGFDELWDAYPRKHARSKARAAYVSLAPDADLHAKLVRGATELAAHYEATGTDPKWRKHLHNWLEGECWLEDLPLPHNDAKDAAIARTKERGSKHNNSGSAKFFPPAGQHLVEIVGSEVSGDAFEQTCSFRHKIAGGKHAGKEFTHQFALASSDELQQKQGHQLFSEIRKATNIMDPQDSSELLGSRLCAVVSRAGKIRYVSAGVG